LVDNHAGEHGGHDHKKMSVNALAYASLGVVFGDIGTSPLYALKECFGAHYGIAVNEANVMGLLSLFTWSLLLVVVMKYIVLVMRAGNNGEGGILALLALAVPRSIQSQFRLGRFMIYVGLLGAALLATDGTITPSISVLSAVEGLEVATPLFKPFVIPITLVILYMLFQAQKVGTAKVAAIFAPAMLVWFAVLSIMGITAITERPDILRSIDPRYAITFFQNNGMTGFWTLGAVVLCITGGEALYADMGHFGVVPIRKAWFAVVLPALLLNYFGQGAHILASGTSTIGNPFFELSPTWALYPLVLISMFATVIASQALISGSFSLAQQAIQMGYSPRLTVVHTSEETRGQIFVPEINWLLMMVCGFLVIQFKTSSNLAAAYGISVMGTMLCTSTLMFFLMRKTWKWSWPKSLGIFVFFLCMDLPFLIANLPKIFEGGWFTIVASFFVFMIMVTWKRGRLLLMKRIGQRLRPVTNFVKALEEDEPHRVKGTAIFMTGNVRMTPPALMHHYMHTQVVHQQIIILSIVTSEVPRVPLKEVLQVEEVGQGMYEVVAHFGFMQSPKIEKIIRLMKIQHGIIIEEKCTTYFLGRDILLTDGEEKMATWRKTLFSFLTRNSVPATSYFGIPPDRVIEIGMQVSI